MQYQKLKRWAGGSVITLCAALVVVSMVMPYLRPLLPLSREAAAQTLLPSTGRSTLDHPTHFTLFSLDPSSVTTGDVAPDESRTTTKLFHGFPILGQTAITAQTTQASLRAALYSGIAHAQFADAICFVPRHGIRAVKNGQTVDLLICFHCGSIETFVNGTQAPERVPTTTSPQPTFDAALKRAHIPLANP